ncbi:helix-turn-helix domain-containing protein [Gemmatimonas sp.]|uniref:helix-turn-helix domain-containing protein n=1 Tax=Gemmatimonas sp. TaxID=1962908 RepID=UPI0035641B64
MPLPIRIIPLRRGDRKRLEQLVRARTTAQRVVERARIVLASAGGDAGNTICAQVGVSRPTVSRWLDRYEAEGLEGLTADRPRAGRPKHITVTDEAAIIARTLETAPPSGTHWSTRLMAQATGHHHATIARIWRAHGLEPHRVKRFELSRAPQFVE